MTKDSQNQSKEINISKGMFWATLGAFLVVGAIIGAAITYALTPRQTSEPEPDTTVMSYTDTFPTASPESTTTTGNTLPELEPVEADAIENGIFTIDKTIQLGTYVSDGPAGKFGCYWALHKDMDNKLGSIIANQHIRSGKVTVEVTKAAVAFETSNCKPWRLVE